MADVRMSLREASEATGIPSNTLRSRYKSGKLRGERDNSGRLFVWIDPTVQGSKSKTSNSSKQVRNEGELEALRGHVETLIRPSCRKRDLLSMASSEGAFLVGPVLGR